MKIKKWRTEIAKISQVELGLQLSKSVGYTIRQDRITKYEAELQAPRADVRTAIFALSKGMVTDDDFELKRPGPPKGSRRGGLQLF